MNIDKCEVANEIEKQINETRLGACTKLTIASPVIRSYEKFTTKERERLINNYTHFCLLMSELETGEKQFEEDETRDQCQVFAHSST